MLILLLKTRVSNPVSHSADVSGLSLGLPIAEASRPVWSVTRFVVVVPNVRSAEVAPGCTPEAPYARRRCIELSASQWGNHASSETLYERLSLGYGTPLYCVPKAVFWS